MLDTPTETAVETQRSKLSAPVSHNMANYFFKHVGFKEVPTEVDCGIFCFIPSPVGSYKANANLMFYVQVPLAL